MRTDVASPKIELSWTDARAVRERIQGVLIRVLFVSLIFAGVSASLPVPISGSRDLLSQLFALNQVWLMPYTRTPLERLGLHHRWNMFTHAPSDAAHAWYNVFYELEFIDANSVTHTGRLPEKTSQDFATRYLDYRTKRFKVNLWSVKDASGRSYLRSQVKGLLAHHPHLSPPIHVVMRSSFTKISPPLSDGANVGPWVNPFMDEIFSAGDLQ